MSADDILNQLNRASAGAKTLLGDLLKTGEATEDVIVSAIRDGVDHLNQILGLNIDLPGLQKPPQSPVSRHLPVGNVTWQRMHDWTVKNRGKTALILAVLVTGAVGAGVAYSRARSRRSPRRAKRTKHGARKEVVVMIGNPGYSTMMRSVALDLEVRGFIVYVVVSSHEDMVAVHKEDRSDIKPLYLATDDSTHTYQAIQQFHEVFDRKNPAFGPRNQLELSGILVTPELSGILKSVDRISTKTWTDFLSTKLTGTIANVTSFLPLAIEHQTRIVILTPSIINALNPPLHSMEATAVGALEAYTQSLRRELTPAGVAVSQLQLGSFDFGALLHGSQYQKTRPTSLSPSIILHDAVFDALTMKGPFKRRWLGRGATLYGIIGTFAPTSLVDWMVSRPKSRFSAAY